MKKRMFALLLCLLLLMSGCNKKGGAVGTVNPSTQGTVADLGNDGKTYGTALEQLAAYDGYFEDSRIDITVECISGTENAYTLEGNTLTFTTLAADSVYAIQGQLRGSIVIDVGDEARLDLELRGLSLLSEREPPVTVLSGDKVTVTAKKNYKNYIYDLREAIAADATEVRRGAIDSEVDLEIAGKGSLTVVSENNNGIHSKKDLEVQNLSLLVACADNALRGNDSVEIRGGSTTLIASAGDGIKTSNTDISSKQNQRGTVSIRGGTHTVYAACDGIDAAYNAVIEEDTTTLCIYTDKYSNYSKEVTAVAAEEYYIRYSDNSYSYSVKYYNSEEDFVWVNATYHSATSGGRRTYYYYSFPKKTEYSKFKFYIYSSDMTPGQESEYVAASEGLSLNSAYDTIEVSNAGYRWTNYTTTVQEGFGGPGGPGGGPGGPGGMNDGNTDKGDYSTKGIKAGNEILIHAGTVTVKSYDDALHANTDTTLENGATPLGNVTVNGGTLTLYSNDDGIHADGTLTVLGGTLSIVNSYEGMEGAYVSLLGGYVSVVAKDDGVNGTATAGTAVTVGGGTLYIHCNGDGIDSNSRASYAGILFSGGNTVILSNSNGNSAIDTEQGYTYEGGAVLALMPRGGMTHEATACRNFQQVGRSSQTVLSKEQYLTVGIDSLTVTVRMPCAMSAQVIVLGDPSPSVKTASASSAALDYNGVCWS